MSVIYTNESCPDTIDVDDDDTDDDDDGSDDDDDDDHDDHKHRQIYTDVSAVIWTRVFNIQNTCNLQDNKTATITIKKKEEGKKELFVCFYPQLFSY